MANKQDYLAQVQVVVSQLHNCGATWRETVPVHEVFRGEMVLQGDVEIFDLMGHRKAKRAYAWGHLDSANDERTRFVAVLEIPPVVSAETAVRFQIVKDVKHLHERTTIDLKFWFLGLCLVLICSGCASVNPHWNDPPPNLPSSDWQLFPNGTVLYSK